MRRYRVVFLLILLVTFGGAVALSLRPGGQDGAPAGGGVQDNRVPAVAPCGAPDSSGGATADTAQGAHMQPDREPDLWVLRGRLRLEPGLWVNPRVLDGYGDSEVSVSFAQVTDDGYDVFVSYCPLRDDWSFEATLTESELPFTPEDGKVPHGIWQVSYTSGYGLDLYDFAEGDAALSELAGITTPHIKGRVIDFGTVGLSNQSLFAGMPVVTGRIVHVSGRPLAHCRGLCLEVLHDDDEVAEAEFHTDGNGRFVVMYACDDVEDVHSDCSHWLYCSYNLAYIKQSWRQSGMMELPAPKITGNLIDYGEITVGGGLLEITAEIEREVAVTWQGGAPAVGFWGEYEGACVKFLLTGYWIDHDVVVYPLPHVSTIWLPEGRYFYRAAVEQSHAFQPRREGAVNFIDGEVTELRLSFSAAGTIPLELESEAPVPDRVSLHWRALDGEREVAVGEEQVYHPFRAPVYPGAVTHVTVYAEGFEPGTGEARAEDEKLTITLTPEQSEACWLRVWLPNFGRYDEEILQPKMTIHARDSDQGPLDRLEDGDLFVFPLPHAGTWVVELTGGAKYGGDGRLCAPVEVYVLPGEEKEIKLPALPALPWETGAEAYVSQITCGGRPCDIRAELETVAGTWAGRLDWDETFEPPARPTGIVDGDHVLPLEALPPTEQSKVAVVKADLPVRVEVRVTRSGQPVSSFRASARAAQFSTSQEVTEGVAKLWLPPGLAAVRVRINNRSLTRPVSVERGEVADVRIDLDWVDLTLNLPSNAGYDGGYDDPPQWVLQAEDGSVAARIKRSGTQTLAPGRYRLVPGWGSQVRPIDVDLNGGVNQTLDLPELPEYRTTQLKLLFDVSVMGDVEVWPDVRLYYAELRRTPASAAFPAAPGARLMPDGLEVLDVPVDVDVVLKCEFWLGESGLRFITAPLRLRLKADPAPVRVTIGAPVRLHEDWYACPAVTPVQGVYIGFGPVLPGRHEVLFLDKGKVALREWVDLPPGTDPVPIPAWLQDKLAALGRLDPE